MAMAARLKKFQLLARAIKSPLLCVNTSRSPDPTLTLNPMTATPPTPLIYTLANADTKKEGMRKKKDNSNEVVIWENDDDGVNATFHEPTPANTYSRSSSFSNLLLMESWSELPLKVDDSEDKLAYGAMCDALNSGGRCLCLQIKNLILKC
ncbi:hypothetical protein NL676_039583 [Syzygium grande]|nr:hypothetical protein NL676_039583 [Syzygium grande]